MEADWTVLLLPLIIFVYLSKIETSTVLESSPSSRTTKSGSYGHPRITSSSNRLRSSSSNRLATTSTSFPPPTFRAPTCLVDYVFTDNFYYLVARNGIFVDKTLFVAEFLRLKERLVSIIRPRKWGKSLTLHMLKLFLEIELDEDGRPLEGEERVCRKLFVGGEIQLSPVLQYKELQPLEIARHLDVMKFQGQYPVIYVHFGCVYGDTYDEIEDRLKTEIEFLYDHYDFLRKSMPANDSQAMKFDRYIERTMTTDDLKDSLRFLSELLAKHFDRKVFVLVDDFDTPVGQLYNTIAKLTVDRGAESDDGKEREQLSVKLRGELNQTLELFNSLHRMTFADNRYLKKSLLMGCFKGSDADVLLTIRDRVREYTLLDEQFSRYFGFTEDDLTYLLSRLPFDVDKKNLDIWYKGYVAGDGLTMYNPWSVMHCLDRHGKFGYYWLEHNETALPPDDEMLLSVKLRADLKKLSSGQHITLKLNPNNVGFVNGFERDDLIHLLLFTGYLTPVTNNGTVYNLTVPNKEVKLLFDNLNNKTASLGDHV